MAEYLPTITWELEVSTRAEDMTARNHNKFAKEALREVLEKYHSEKTGFAKHFRRDARQKYGHAPRSENYKRHKQRRYHSTVDLVKTGNTKRRMLAEPTFRMGGTAAGGTLKATLLLRFPFKGGTGRSLTRVPSSQTVSIQQMAAELRRFAEEDPEQFAKDFKAAYMKRVDAHRAGRKRVRKVTK